MPQGRARVGGVPEGCREAREGSGSADSAAGASGRARRGVRGWGRHLPESWSLLGAWRLSGAGPRARRPGSPGRD